MSKFFCIIPFFLPLFSGFISSSFERTEENEKQFRIIIRKAERKLYLYRLEEKEENLQKSYQISLGTNPTGSKRRQGDGATPEGDYYITHKNPRSRFYLSLGLSYPNISDADAGLKAGLISKRDYEAIAAAIRQKNKPPQNTRLGGDIFIHGGGSGTSDWTIGCIALENEAMKELFHLIPVKTPVKIIP